MIEYLWAALYLLLGLGFAEYCQRKSAEKGEATRGATFLIVIGFWFPLLAVIALRGLLNTVSADKKPESDVSAERESINDN